MWICWNLPAKVDLQWIMEGGGLSEKSTLRQTCSMPDRSRFIGLSCWAAPLGGRERLSADVSVFILASSRYADCAASPWDSWTAVDRCHAVSTSTRTVGEEGAFEGMWDGTVDENWAKQHHSIWYERELKKGNAPVTQLPDEKMLPAE